MSRFDWLNWGVALLLSLSLHAWFIMYKNTHVISSPTNTIEKNITHISFSSFVPAAEPEPEPIPEEKPEPQPEPEIKPEVKTLPKPKPVPVPKPKPKPKAKPKPKPKPKPAKSQHKSSPVKEITQQPVPATVSSKPKPVLLSQVKQTYLALLLRHVEVHKIYPKAARRRKIEGKIQVTFTLYADGSIRNLQINGKRSLLKKASRVAIDGALPMPKPPAELSLPMHVEFSMKYFLK